MAAENHEVQNSVAENQEREHIVAEYPIDNHECISGNHMRSRSRRGLHNGDPLAVGLIGNVGLIKMDLRTTTDPDDGVVLTIGADEATQAVGQTGTDVTVVDEMGVEGNIPNVGKTKLLE